MKMTFIEINHHTNNLLEWADWVHWCEEKIGVRGEHFYFDTGKNDYICNDGDWGLIIRPYQEDPNHFAIGFIFRNIEDAITFKLRFGI
jgi:hypothetical protein